MSNWVPAMIVYGNRLSLGGFEVGVGLSGTRQGCTSFPSLAYFQMFDNVPGPRVLRLLLALRASLVFKFLGYFDLFDPQATIGLGMLLGRPLSMCFFHTRLTKFSLLPEFLSLNNNFFGE